MSKALRVPEYLEHILSAIKRIERHVTDVDELGFLQSLSSVTAFGMSDFVPIATL